jgi:chemotaxis receptor (MCP) glutamine deamidase CheD
MPSGGTIKGMNESISVGLGEQVISSNSPNIIVAYGLGSCLGIGIYDPIRRVAGLLLAFLSERTNGNDPLSPKYVDSGIAILLDAMIMRAPSEEESPCEWQVARTCWSPLHNQIPLT